MKHQLISCEIFRHEIQALLAECSEPPEVTFLPKALHDEGRQRMQAALQKAIEAVDLPETEAILLGYGLCNLGTAGLQTRHALLVLPRAHDCITLFMGHRQRYLDYFESHPGTYFLTPGWLVHTQQEGEMPQQSMQHEMAMDQTYSQLVERYGEDNAAFLYEQLHQTHEQYERYTYITNGLECDHLCAAKGRCLAARKAMDYEVLKGNLCLLRRLINGPWDEEEFLVVSPGTRIAAAGDHDRIVTAEEVHDDT